MSNNLDIQSTDDFLFPPKACWSLPKNLAGALLYSANFDPLRLTCRSFARYSVDLFISIQRSAVKRRVEFLAGRLCAHAAIISLTEQGKVLGLGLDHAPVWPAGLCGSITHADGSASAIVARRSDWRSLGFDIEQLLDENKAIRMAADVLTHLR